MRLDATKEWRTDWWHDIANYTLHGDYFWGGKGYGINLADDDGYQVGDETLHPATQRAHDDLARSGVVGIAAMGVRADAGRGDRHRGISPPGGMKRDQWAYMFCSSDASGPRS